MVYVGAMSNDGRKLTRVLVYKQKRARMAVTPARRGSLSFADHNHRSLTLGHCFRVQRPPDSRPHCHPRAYPPPPLPSPTPHPAPPSPTPLTLNRQDAKEAKTGTKI